jgi:peptidoglycan hydrolase-like protein with peptidoglycan-binding domain
MLAVATAEGPQGGGHSGPAILFAADEVSVDVESDDEAVARGNHGGESPGEIEIEVEEDVAFDAPALAENRANNADSLAADVATTPAPPSALRAPAAAPAAVPQPAQDDVLIRAPVPGSPTPVIAPLPPADIANFQFRLPLQDQIQFTSTEVNVAQTSSANPETLKLEIEYWDLKAHGLKMKADALRMKAKGWEEAGTGSEADRMVAEADAQLTLAEMKLSQLNGRRAKDALEAAEARQLKQGSKGAKVRALQQTLNALVQPSPKLDVDGDFGPLTAKAVKSFQKAQGLSSSGVVDDNTWSALTEGEMAGRWPQPVPAAAPAAAAKAAPPADILGAWTFKGPPSVTKEISGRLIERVVKQKAQAAAQADAAAKAAKAAHADAIKGLAEQIKALEEAKAQLQKQVEEVEEKRQR